MTVVNDSGESLNLAVAYREGPVLLYFYPKAFTPGCTAQACNIRDNFDEVQAAGITVFGVSRDKVAKQAEFREEYALPFTLIADEDGALGEAFGVANFMGSAYRRQSFLIVDGQVVWSDLSADPATQSSDAVAALEAVKRA